jgi:hypothetical protein
MPPAARPLRVIVLLHAVLVFVQAAAAGQFLAGHAAWLRVHETNAGIIHLVALVQLVVAILVWRPGRGPGWPALASLALLLAEESRWGSATRACWPSTSRSASPSSASRSSWWSAPAG